MSTFDLFLMLMTPGGCLLGGWSIYWARGQHHPGLVLWGRRLFTFTLLLLGCLTWIAAWVHSHSLAPLGLVAGLLVVGMLWESKVEIEL